MGENSNKYQQMYAILLYQQQIVSDGVLQE